MNKLRYLKNILLLIIFMVGLSGYSGESTNGLQLNGFTLNGLQLNGLRLNQVEDIRLTHSYPSKRCFRQGNLAEISRTPLAKIRLMVDKEDE